MLRILLAAMFALMAVHTDHVWLSMPMLAISLLWVVSAALYMFGGKVDR